MLEDELLNQEILFSPLTGNVKRVSATNTTTSVVPVVAYTTVGGNVTLACNRSRNITSTSVGWYAFTTNLHKIKLQPTKHFQTEPQLDHLIGQQGEEKEDDTGYGMIFSVTISNWRITDDGMFLTCASECTGSCLRYPMLPYIIEVYPSDSPTTSSTEAPPTTPTTPTEVTPTTEAIGVTQPYANIPPYQLGGVAVIIALQLLQLAILITPWLCRCALQRNNEAPDIIIPNNQQ